MNLQTAGTLLKEAREQKERSLSYVARQTKIKEKFLEAIENSDWASLPNFTIAQGFARSYAQVVDLNPTVVAALLRRDFPQTKVSFESREMSLKRQSLWTPRTTIFAVITLCILALGLYLGTQYFQFAAPPALSISRLEKGPDGIVVLGKTTQSATVEVNGRPVLVENDGTFKVLLMNQDLIGSKVEVQATSRTGKKSYLSKTVD